jgi:hypothetical protein
LILSASDVRLHSAQDGDENKQVVPTSSLIFRAAFRNAWKPVPETALTTTTLQSKGEQKGAALSSTLRFARRIASANLYKPAQLAVRVVRPGRFNNSNE